MEDEYFDFLVSFLGEDESQLPSMFDSYFLLMKLYRTEFRYSAMMDRNRDMDGREWRNRYGGGSHQHFSNARLTFSRFFSGWPIVWRLSWTMTRAPLPISGR